MLSNKARFVEEVCRGELVVSNRKRSELLVDIEERGYDLFPKDDNADDSQDGNNGDDDEVMADCIASDTDLAKGYECESYVRTQKSCSLCILILMHYTLQQTCLE